ncbi:hypothetical protein EOD42_08875 [Rhodovarius crocodyli]|uniref:Bacteriophage tail tape measure N-terminal domain-containing protein n=1 Tax=Rhodovarius crocodyli TaxID=1979269 RepID=A0A437MJT6_9PROT|nr:hypothetical protein [Rhodovarius crocodyli]RVT97893.1 hypothetical protein EOD42_08875 [Rhodovarius crocodyli]
MAGFAGGGVSMRVSVEAADRARQLLEGLGQAGQAALQQIPAAAEVASTALEGTGAAAEKSAQSQANLARAFARTQAVLDPAAAAAERLARQLDVLNRTEASGAESAQRVGELRVAALRRFNEAVEISQSRLGTMSAAVNGAAAATARLDAANDNASRGGARLGQVMGQAGYQIQDFAVQVSAGQSALVAFGQQGSQLLGVFGTGGAIAGAALTVGVLAAQLVNGRSETERFNDVVKRLAENFRQVQDEARTYHTALETEASAVRELTERYNALSVARQQQEIRNITQDRAALQGEQNALQRQVLERVGPMAAGVRSDLWTMQEQAAQNYGRGSQEYNLIVSNEDVQRLRTFVEVVEGFREAGNVSREALAQLHDALMGLVTGNDQVSENIRKTARELDGFTGNARQLEERMEQLSQRARAAGLALDESGGSAERAAARMRRAALELQGFELNVAASLSREVANIQRLNEAASQGEDALRRARADIATEDRARRYVADYRQELQRLGITGQEAEQAVAGYTAAVNASLGTLQTGNERLRQQEAAFRGAARAAQDMRDLYEVLRRDASTGLLSMSPSDDRAFQVIRQQTAEGRRTQREEERARERAETESRREAERAQQQAERFAQNWGDRIADATTQGLFDGFKNGESAAATLSRTFTNLLRQAASAILSQTVTTPMVRYVSGLLGGVSPTAVAAGTAGTAAGGSESSLLSTGGGALSIGRNLFGGSGGGFGGYSFLTSPTGMANTGWGGLDSLLNTNLYTPAANGALTPSGFYSGTAMSGEPGAFVGGGGDPMGITLGGALGSALAIGGGIFGAVNGFQRGGVGGTLQGLGGVTSAVTGAASLGSSLGLLPALGALGPAGIIGGAVLALIGGLLPGQKPSGKGQEFRLDLYSLEEERNGLTGARYSAANATQAETAVRNLEKLASTIGDQLGGLRLGGELAVGVTSGRGGNDPGNLYLDYSGSKAQFANTEEGAQQLASRATEFLLEGFKNIATGDYRGILNASGNNVDTLTSNLDWYKNTYQALTGTQASEFEKSLKALEAQWQTQIDKARELSLATEQLTATRDKELDRLRAQRALQVSSYDTGLEVRSLRARGENQQADLMAFDVAGRAEILQAQASLEALGLTAAEVASRITRTEEVLGEERVALVKRYAQQAADAQKAAAQSVLDWLNGQALSSTSSLSPTERLRIAQGNLDTALSGSDATKVTSAADALLTLSQQVYGGASSTYAQREAFVRGEVADYGAYSARQSGDSATIRALEGMVQMLDRRLAEMGAKFDALANETRINMITRNLNS